MGDCSSTVIDVDTRMDWTLNERIFREQNSVIDTLSPFFPMHIQTFFIVICFSMRIDITPPQLLDDVAVAKLQSDVVAVLGGGEVQVQMGLYGSAAVVGAEPPIVSAFTSTGITAPVARRKGRWPRTTPL